MLHDDRALVRRLVVMNELCRRMSMLPVVAKAVLITGGYVGAVLLAVFSVWLNAMLADPVVGNASAGMQAFGDSLLFIVVFGLAATLPTGLALFFWHGLRARKP
jgi:hypothetical protein